MLCSPFNEDVIDVPSAVPTIFEFELGFRVKGSWNTYKVPKGVVVWLVDGPATPFTIRYAVLFMVSC